MTKFVVRIFHFVEVVHTYVMSSVSESLDIKRPKNVVVVLGRWSVARSDSPSCLLKQAPGPEVKSAWLQSPGPEVKILSPGGAHCYHLVDGNPRSL